MAKAVLLDIDGTLIDSNALHAEAWQRAFAHFGVKVDFDAVLRQIGKGGDQLLPVFLSPAQQKEFGEKIQKWRKDLFMREYLSQVRPFPRVREMVLAIQRTGKKIAIASSASEEELEKYKRIAHVEDLIDANTTSEDAEESKPQPDIFAVALKQLKMPAEEALSVGDTPWDAIASGKIGVRTIGVMSGGWKREELEQAGCIEVYADAADLLDHFEGSLLSQ
ncbi:MAG: HAD family hydrolase [Acidobacteriaceae bacterium]